MRITTTTDEAKRQQCRRFIEENVLEFVHRIDITTRDAYADIMQRIWQTHPPASVHIKTQRHLSEHGVDVNDVWIAAVALEHGLTLLTEDSMDTIRNCVPELVVENWLV